MIANVLHTVAITGTDDAPRIEFTCHGTAGAECHSYPDCDCESWVRGNHEHPFVTHDECWMKSWFDNVGNGGAEPCPDCLDEQGLRVGMRGPVLTHWDGEYVSWEFTEVPS